MSVIVKNMQMPESCNYCRFSDGFWCYALTENGKIIVENQRKQLCPLVEIPTPHGKLIDADAAHANIRPFNDEDPTFIVNAAVAKQLCHTAIDITEPILKEER